MTEPRQQEFALGDDFARILTETTQSLVCVLDRTGRVVFFNDACERATGFSREEVVGVDARDHVIPPEEAAAFGEVLDQVWTTSRPSPQVGHWATRDGGRRLIAWSNRPMLDDAGVPLYLVASGIDLTASVADDRAFEGDLWAKLAEVGRLAQEHRSLRRVATLVASQASPERVFRSVSEEAARVLEVSASAVFRYEGDDTATIVGRVGRDDLEAFRLGSRLHADENLTIGRVLRTGAPARVDDYSQVAGETARQMIDSGYCSAVSAPIVVGGILWGAVAVAARHPLPADSEARLTAFCELVSLAVASAQAREDLAASRRRIVTSGDEQRRKLERNLHDGAQQRLVSVALELGRVRTLLGTEPAAAAEALESTAAELDLALDDLRELARGLHPAMLTEHGLRSALELLGARLPVTVKIESPKTRLPPQIEATTYYIAAETLTNVAKHAKATEANVTIHDHDGVLHLEITDDGCGGADPSGGSGLLGLRDRAEAAGGTLYVVSPPGRGTTVTATLPMPGPEDSQTSNSADR
jgi:PAS domain S-box-containing protein